jgi:hypothetical protein
MRKVALGLFGVVACAWASIEVSAIDSPGLTGCGPLADDPVGDAATAGGGNEGGSSGGSDAGVHPGKDSGSGGSHDGGGQTGHDGGGGSEGGGEAEAGSDDAGEDSAPSSDDAAQPQCTSVTTWVAGAGLPNAGWSATATATPTSDGNPGDAVTTNAFDNSLTTRWSSGQAQTSAAGLEFTLDLGSVQSFDQVVLFYPAAGDAGTTDFPNAYSIAVSTSAAGPFNTVGSGTGGSPTAKCFATQSAQYIKITETGTSPSAAWLSIYEMQVFNN